MCTEPMEPEIRYIQLPAPEPEIRYVTQPVQLQTERIGHTERAVGEPLGQMDQESQDDLTIK